MKSMRVLVGILALAALAALAWWSWHVWATPVPPALPLASMDAEVADVISKAIDDVRRQPRSGEAWGRLAMASAANGFYPQALECFAQAERLQPSDPRWPYLHGHWLRDGRPGEPFPFWRRALECPSTPEQKGTILFRLALGLIETGHDAEAEVHLRTLQEIEGNSPRVHLGHGLLAVARDDMARVREHMPELVASPHARKLACGHLAALAVQDGDDAMARHYQQRSAQSPVDLPWPDVFVEEMNQYAASRDKRVREAAALESAGRMPEAIAILRQTALASRDGSAYLALGIALTKVNQLEDAEENLTLALRLDEKLLYAHHFLATIRFTKAERLYAEPGGKEQALALFREVVAFEDKALTIKAHDPFVHMTRGRALRYLGRTDEALQALRAAVLARPGFAEMHLVLGEALAEAGRLPEALTHLEDAVRCAEPDDPRPRAAFEKWRTATPR